MLWDYWRMRATIGLWRLTLRLMAWLGLLILLLAAAPVTLTAGLGLLVAWLRGWPPARLRRTAAWSLPMLAVWLAGLVITAVHTHNLLDAVPHAWRLSWHDATTGRLLTAAVLALPAAVPAGLLCGPALKMSMIRAVGMLMVGKHSAPLVGTAGRCG